VRVSRTAVQLLRLTVRLIQEISIGLSESPLSYGLCVWNSELNWFYSIWFIEMLQLLAESVSSWHPFLPPLKHVVFIIYLKHKTANNISKLQARTSQYSPSRFYHKSSTLERLVEQTIRTICLYSRPDFNLRSGDYNTTLKLAHYVNLR